MLHKNNVNFRYHISNIGFPVLTAALKAVSSGEPGPATQRNYHLAMIGKSILLSLAGHDRLLLSVVRRNGTGSIRGR